MSSAPASPMERASVPSAEPTPPRPRPGMIQKAAVLGAGTMGSRIAAHLANAGLQVVLLDIPARRTRPASGRCRRSKLSRRRSRQRSTTRLVCRPNPRRQFQRRSRHAGGLCLGDRGGDRKPGHQAGADREDRAASQARRHSHHEYQRSADCVDRPKLSPEHLRPRCFGTHFFNPPRYMRLPEVIPTPETDPAAVAALAHFADLRLGKTVFSPMTPPTSSPTGWACSSCCSPSS